MARIPKHTAADLTPAQRTAAIKIANNSGFSKAERGYAKLEAEEQAPKPLALKLTGDDPAVKARQRIEQTIALVAAQALLDAGYLLGVNNGEEITIHHSRDIAKIQAALFTTDEDYLYVYVKGTNPKDTRPDYWVRFVYGNDGWDVISDYSVHLESAFELVQKLIDYASDNGVVPDLYLRDGKVTV